MNNPDIIELNRQGYMVISHEEYSRLKSKSKPLIQLPNLSMFYLVRLCAATSLMATLVGALGNGFGLIELPEGFIVVLIVTVVTVVVASVFEIAFKLEGYGDSPGF